MKDLEFRAWTGTGFVYSRVEGDKYKKANYLSGFFKNHGFADIEQYSTFKLKKEKLFEGDILTFTYGIPIVKVNAPIVFKNGAFYVITENHNPKEMLLFKFLELGFDVYKNGTIHDIKEK